MHQNFGQLLAITFMSYPTNTPCTNHSFRNVQSSIADQLAKLTGIVLGKLPYLGGRFYEPVTLKLEWYRQRSLSRST